MLVAALSWMDALTDADGGRLWLFLFLPEQTAKAAQRRLAAHGADSWDTALEPSRDHALHIRHKLRAAGIAADEERNRSGATHSGKLGHAPSGAGESFDWVHDRHAAT